MSSFVRALSVGILAYSLTLQPAHADDHGVVATINGIDILAQEVEAQSRQLAAQGHQASDEQIVQELINLEVMRQEAARLKLGEDPAVQAELKTMQSRVLANALLTSFTSQVDITDQQLQAEYQRHSSENQSAEFLASHILLEDEARATEIIAELDGGADFAEAAKKYSTGPSGANGGSLGWFAEGAMVPEFSAAVAQMQVGKHSATPVKTDFGWHIIKLEDKRSKGVEPFEALAPQLRSLLIRQQVAEYISSLRGAALIEQRK